ncbi:MAG: hypothetical protein V2J25_01995 [Desulfatiglans sp.]|jgi:hypothetical protein|nr:hypothetical protein [Thermodesulfobacteriota bacterium]MEE4351620.1 hypothetical protein [Desulfatiglans sp.]
MDESNSERELDSIAGLFISSDPERAQGDDGDGEFEIEESVKVTRKFGHSHTKNAQQNMKKLLFTHLQEDYSISRIVLTRKSDSLGPQKKISREEEVVIFLKDS